MLPLPSCCEYWTFAETNLFPPLFTFLPPTNVKSRIESPQQNDNTFSKVVIDRKRFNTTFVGYKSCSLYFDQMIKENNGDRGETQIRDSNVGGNEQTRWGVDKETRASSPIPPGGAARPPPTPTQLPAQLSIESREGEPKSVKRENTHGKKCGKKILKTSAKAHLRGCSRT